MFNLFFTIYSTFNSHPAFLTLIAQTILFGDQIYQPLII